MPLGRPLAARSSGDPPTRGIGDGCTRLHESDGLAGGGGSLLGRPPLCGAVRLLHPTLVGLRSSPAQGEAPLLGGEGLWMGGCARGAARPGTPQPGGSGAAVPGMVSADTCFCWGSRDAYVV